MRFVLAAFALLAMTGAALAAPSADPKKAPTGSYSMDPRHSLVVFAIPHLGITDYYGRFDRVTGSLSFNAGAPEKSSVNVTIDMTTIDTPSKELIGELSGGSVFDAAKYPTATFKSTAVTRTGPNTGTITGDLTIKGITKPIEATGSWTAPAPDAFGNTRGHLNLEAVIDRTEWDINWNLPLPSGGNVLANDVTLTVEISLVEQQQA